MTFFIIKGKSEDEICHKTKERYLQKWGQELITQ